MEGQTPVVLCRTGTEARKEGELHVALRVVCVCRGDVCVCAGVGMCVWLYLAITSTAPFPYPGVCYRCVRAHFKAT